MHFRVTIRGTPTTRVSLFVGPFLISKKHSTLMKWDPDVETLPTYTPITKQQIQIQLRPILIMLATAPAANV